MSNFFKRLFGINSNENEIEEEIEEKMSNTDKERLSKFYASIQAPPQGVLKRTLLLNALKDCVYALSNDSVYYDWVKTSSCNCGIVAQCILDTNRELLHLAFEADRDYVPQVVLQNNCSPTWKQLVKYTCNATGNSISKIITVLSEHGLKPEDMVHLEYLENPAILKQTDIDTKEKNYYQKKYNLIKYLKVWIKILETKKNHYTITELNEFDKIELEERILISNANDEIDNLKELKLELIKRG